MLERALIMLFSLWVRKEFYALFDLVSDCALKHSVLPHGKWLDLCSCYIH